MANTPEYNWPPMNGRKVIGKPVKRLDGPQKAAGRAQYGSDKTFPGMLFASYLSCPHAHARVTAVDTSAAEKTAGVRSVHVIAPAGKEIQWQGAEIAALAADSEEIARDAIRKIKVDYEVLPHFVDAENLAAAGAHGKAAGETVTGDPDKAIQDAEVVSDGTYGIPIATHCCLEPHGCVVQWKDDQVMAWPSTQFVTGWAGTLAPNLKIPAANIKVHQDYIGGGFGSKFSPGAWAEVGAILSQKAGGKPVKIFLERNMELEIAGHRPAAYGKFKVAGKKDGTITAWQSDTWASGGFPGSGSPPLPYVYSNIPNQRRNHTSVSTNIAGSQAWRAPNNQQASYLTCCAIEDFAAKAGLDPMEVFAKNAELTPRADIYRSQMEKAAELSEWKKFWKARGSQTGAIRRGLGMGVDAWNGLGHNCTARTTIGPDGSVLLEMGTQDLGTGTRTVMVQVAAETLGLQPGQIKLVIGDNSLPPGGSSGGSTTVGGVSAATRKSSMNALYKLFDAVAPAWNVQPEQLEAVDGQIRVKGTPNKSMTWAAACKKIGPAGKIQETGANVSRNPMGLISGGVAGVQVADVNVDTETGLVRVNRYVAVQDCGMVINPRLSESQVYGGIIMGISTALYEERITDNETGRMLNADMEFYKLAGIRDVGDIIVHMDIREVNDQRGVIGLGEPPAIAICAAIGNAVANAIGARVPHIPMTPMHVLDTLEGRKSVMQSFEYANPTTVQEAVGLLAAKAGETEVLAGGTDLLAMMKERLLTPKRLVNIKNIKELEGIGKADGGLRIGALATMDDLARSAEVKASCKAISDAAAFITSPQIRHMGTAGGDLCQRPRCWYFRNGFGLLAMKDGKSLVPDGANQYHAIFGAGPAHFVSASSLGPALIALNAKVKLVSAKGAREVPVANFFVVPANEDAREIALRPDEILTEIIVPAATVKSATYEVRQKEALDWPLATASVVLTMRGNAVGSAKIVMGHVAPKPWDSAEAARAIAGKAVTNDTAEAAGKAAVAAAKPLSQNAYKVTLARVAVKRALLEAAKKA